MQDLGAALVKPCGCGTLSEVTGRAYRNVTKEFTMSSKEERKNLRVEIKALEEKAAVVAKKIEKRKARLAELEAIRADKRMKKVIEMARREAEHTAMVVADIKKGDFLLKAGEKVYVGSVNPIEKTADVRHGNDSLFVGATVPATSLRPLTADEKEAHVKFRMAQAGEAFKNEEATREAVTQKLEAMPDEEKDADRWESAEFIMDRLVAWAQPATETK